MCMKSKFFVFLCITILCASIFSNHLGEARGGESLESARDFVLANHPFGYQDVLREYFPTDEWRICTPEEQGMNSTLLNEMLPYIDSNDWPIDSIILVRGGYIVYEKYQNPEFEMDDYHTLQSVTKSFTSALVGIAIQEGFIPSLDATILDLFSNHNVTNVDERKEHMSVKHLLTMTAGVEWDEWSYPYNDIVHNSLAAMVTSDDAVDFFLNLPMVAEPGEEWVYNGGAAMLLGVLIEEMSNLTLMDFAQEYLFNPIGISGAVWLRTWNGIFEAGGGLYLKPRDMARFGYLFLNGGTWDGEQVISNDWVLDSTDYHFSLPPYDYYGYFWWLNPAMNVYQALGSMGQRIMVSPEEDLVVIFTASIHGMEYHPHQELYFDFILKSIIGPPRTMTQSTNTTDTITTTIDVPDGIDHGLISLSAILLPVGIFSLVTIVVLLQLRYRKMSQ